MTYENLDKLKEEIEAELREKKFAVFYGLGRSEIDRDMSINWDTEAHPDFREFLTVAEGAGIKIVIVYYKILTQGHIAELMDQLDDLDLDRDERRNLSRDLQRLKMYEGFISSVDLSFDTHGQSYMFSVSTNWFKSLLEIAGQFDVFGPGFDGEDVDNEPLGGAYFSKN